MCPGGFIVPSATENDEVVVNGMSLSRRNSPFANSGFVVTVEPEDTDAYLAEHGVLSGIAYQKALEIATSHAGGGMQKAPGQRVVDFLAGRVSQSLPKTTYHPGITAWDLNELLPQSVCWRMREGLQFFNRKLRGFAGEAGDLGGETTEDFFLRQLLKALVQQLELLNALVERCTRHVAALRHRGVGHTRRTNGCRCRLAYHQRILWRGHSE